jgi:hypothetical protein
MPYPANTEHKYTRVLLHWQTFFLCHAKVRYDSARENLSACTPVFQFRFLFCCRQSAERPVVCLFLPRQSHLFNEEVGFLIE